MKTVTKTFKVHGSKYEDFTKVLSKVLPPEAKVTAYTEKFSDVSVTVPKQKSKVLRLVRQLALTFF